MKQDGNLLTQTINYKYKVIKQGLQFDKDNIKKINNKTGDNIFKKK